MAINECKLNDIKIYRGTYDEIKALPTKNMALYLAWDRHMLLVGNNTGKKVPYGSIPELVRIEIDTRIRELTTNGEFDNWVNNTILYNLEERIEKAFNEELGEEIEEIHATASIVRELNELIKSVDNHVVKVEDNLNNLSEHLKDDFYTKEDIDKYNTEFTGKLDEDLSDIRTQVGAANRGVVETKEIIDEIKEGLGSVNINITNVYTKTQVDKIVDDTKEELEGLVEENSIQHMKSSAIERPMTTYGLRRTAVEEEKGKLILVTDNESEDFAFGDLLYQTSNGIYHVGEQHLYKNLLDYVPREELNEVILGYYTKSEIDELIKRINLGDISDILKDYIKKDEVYTKSEVDELIDNVQVDLSEYYTKTEVNDLIKDFNTDNVQELLKDYLTIDAAANEYYSKAAIDKLLAEFKPSVEVDLSDYYTKAEIDTKLDELVIPEGSTVDLSNYYTKSEVDGKIPDVSKFITADDIPVVEVPTKLSELENDKNFITLAEVPVVEVPTKLSELENDTLFIDQYDMSALTGDEMNALLKNPTELNKYSLVFCKKNSTSGLAFKRGTLYYVDNESFEAMSGGSSAPIEKEVIKSTFTVTENGGVNNFEIENSTRELIFTIKANNVNAIDNAKFSGENLELSQLVDGVTVKKTLNLNEAKTTSFKLTYTTKTDTSLIDYQVSANNTSFSYNVVAPTFYGQGKYSEGKLQKTLNTGNLTIKPKTFGFEPNNMFYLYSPIVIESNDGNDFAIEVGGFECDYSSTTEFITVNGLECMYYVYYFNISDPDITISVER